MEGQNWPLYPFPGASGRQQEPLCEYRQCAAWRLQHPFSPVSYTHLDVYKRQADAGFIGEQSPGNAEAGGALQRASDKTACGRFCPEGAAYNQRYSGEQEIPVQDKQIQTTGNIEEAQSRNHAGTEFADGFDAAQNDQAGGKCCQNANDMR